MGRPVFSVKTEDARDIATRTSDWKSNRNGNTVADASTTTHVAGQNGDGADRILEKATVVCNDNGAAVTTDKIKFLLQVKDGSGGNIYEETANGPDAVFDVPGVTWPDGANVNLTATNFIGTGETVGFGITISWRSE